MSSLYIAMMFGSDDSNGTINLRFENAIGNAMQAVGSFGFKRPSDINLHQQGKAL